MNRGAPAVEYLYGVHPVFEALTAGRRKFREIWLAADGVEQRLAPIADLAKKRAVKVHNVSADKLRSHVGPAVHQGVVAVVGPLPFVALNEVLPVEDQQVQGSGIWVLLDSIVDPHNLGAIVRTALCGGVKAVIIPKDRSAPPSPAASKASAGALEHMAMVSVTNLANTLQTLKSHGIWVAGLDAGADRTIYEQDLSGPLALVVGGEEKGIRPRVRQQCDFLLSIPQVGRVSSLNASVAAAVVIFEAFRQQK